MVPNWLNISFILRHAWWVMDCPLLSLRPLLVKHIKEWVLQTCCISDLSCYRLPHRRFLPLQSIEVCDAFQCCKQLLWLHIFSFPPSPGSSLWKKKAQNSKNWPFLLLGHLELENCYHFTYGYWHQIKPEFSKSTRFFHKTAWQTLNLLTENFCSSPMDSLKGLKTTF